MILNRKELTSILIAVLVLAFIISLVETMDLFLSALLAVFLVISINVIAKKVTSYYLESEIEIKLWEVRRYGFKPSRHFKKPIPAGVIFPIVIIALSFGAIKWVASLVFDVKSKVYRAAKRHGLYSFSEMSESHIGMIAAGGIFANLVFAVIGYLLGFPLFTKINILYAFFNMFPFSDLDGNKIFFGNIVTWSFLAAITLIGIAYVILIV